MASTPHALLLPFPCQGHVIPLLELAYCLSDHGFKITFVVTDFIHACLAAASSKFKRLSDEEPQGIHVVSVPDGLEPHDTRADLIELGQSLECVTSVFLEELIHEKNRLENDQITCLVADNYLRWVFPLAKKLGLRSVAFSTAAAAVLVAVRRAPELIKDGFIGAVTGAPQRDGMIQLSHGMPPIQPSELPWNTVFNDRDLNLRAYIFSKQLKLDQVFRTADIVVCNSCYELEPSAFNLIPKLIPIGPLRPGHRPGKPIGNFWPEDPICITWLDEQPTNSVIYVAFGSLTIFGRTQFHELALGLELTGRPFLWVVRADMIENTSDAFPVGFRARVAERAKFIAWSPQHKVLAHSSIACFLTHCGWNSTMEGVANGVPFLCWPYFSDQFLNRAYVCDAWKTGLRVSADENGLVSREEVRAKVEEVFKNEEMKARAMELKSVVAKSISQDGSSFKSFISVVDAMRGVV